MANFGRFVCVLVPFLMTLASLAAMLVGGLAGVADKSLFMFEVNAENLTIPVTSLADLLSRSLDERHPQNAVGYHDPSLLSDSTTTTTTNDGDSAKEASTTTTTSSASSSTTTSSTAWYHDPSLLSEDEDAEATDSSLQLNVTGSTLGIADIYDVGLWGVCQTAHNGTRTCSKPAYNWAPGTINQTVDQINNLAHALGKNITWPKEVTDAFDAFETVTKWTEVVFLIAYIALGVELLLGLFATCSRVMSCLTFLVALVATVAVCAASSLATAMAVVVVGTLEATAKWYGVTADFDTRFLAAVWIGAAFALGAGFFWLFTICCCAPDHHRASRRSARRAMEVEAEKLIPASNGYVPLQHDNAYAGAYASPAQRASFIPAGAGAGRRHEGAYEPYSHSNV